MGKGVIVSHLGDAHYRIGLDIDVSYARNALYGLQTYLAEFAPAYAEATQKKDDALAALTPINDRLTDYLAAGQAASQAAYDAMVAAYEDYADAVQNLPDQEMVQAAQDDADEVSGLFAANPNEETALDTLAADSLWQSVVGDFLDAAAVQAATDAKNAAIADLVTAQQEFDLGNIPEEALTFFQQNYATLRGDWLTVVSENSGPARVSTLEGQWQEATDAFNKAREDLGKLLDNGGMPEELAKIVADQEKAYADYHAALQNWQSMLMVKTEKEKLAAELQSRLITYTDNDGNPIRQEVTAWCCDFTEDLAEGAEVATIEIPGERDLAVRVRPGYESRETYSAERDGLLQPSWASSPEATYWNWALHPGNARWHPNYRLGEILLIDAQAGTCTVQLDQQTNNAKSCARDGTALDVNNPIKYQIDSITGEQTTILPGDNVQVDGGVTTLTDVTIEYMECNAAIFEIGDKVIVEFEGRDWASPKVIGFAESPRPCLGDSIFCTSEYANNETLQYKGAVGTDYENSTYKFIHSPPNLEGGNIDWRGSDGTVLTWNGPLGRTIVSRFWNFAYNWYLDEFFDEVGANVKAPDYTVYKIKYRADITGIHDVNKIRTEGKGGFLFMSRFSSSLWRRGKLYAKAPGIDQILGAAIVKSKDDQNKPINLLVVATCRTPIGIDYLNDTPEVKKLNIYACVLTDAHDPDAPEWQLVLSQDMGEKALPPVHNVFFSDDGLKFVTLWPQWRMPYHYGIDYQDPEAIQSESTIVRGTLVANGVTLTGTITLQNQTPYDWDDANIHKSAVIGIDIKGGSEVTLTATYNRSHVLHSPDDPNSELARDLSSITQSLTWTGSDTKTYASSTQDVTEIYFPTSETDYNWGSTSTDAVDRPLYVDLRHGVCVKIRYASQESAYLTGAAYIGDQPTPEGTKRVASLNSSMSITDQSGRVFYQSTYNTVDQTSEVPSGSLFQGNVRSLLRGIFSEHGPLTQYYGRERPYDGEAVSSMAFDCAISPLPRPTFDNQDVMHTINDYIPNGVPAVNLYFSGYRSIIDKNGNCMFWINQNLAHAVPMLTSDNTLTYGGYSWCAYPLWSTNGEPYSPFISVLFATKSNAETAWSAHLTAKHPEEMPQTVIEAGIVPRFAL